LRKSSFNPTRVHLKLVVNDETGDKVAGFNPTRVHLKLDGDGFNTYTVLDASPPRGPI